MIKPGIDFMGQSAGMKTYWNKFSSKTIKILSS